MLNKREFSPNEKDDIPEAHKFPSWQMLLQRTLFATTDMLTPRSKILSQVETKYGSI